MVYILPSFRHSSENFNNSQIQIVRVLFRASIYREMEEARDSLEAELKHSENSFAGTFPLLNTINTPGSNIPGLLVCIVTSREGAGNNVQFQGPVAQ